MNTSDTIVQRLDEMEVKLTFVDDTVQELATADANLALRIASLERALRELRGELSAMRVAQADDPHNEPPPPHY
ncbi:SlyX family protein [Rhodanobacter koreensis]